MSSRSKMTRVVTAALMASAVFTSSWSGAAAAAQVQLDPTASGAYSITGIREFDWQSSGDLVIANQLPGTGSVANGVTYTTFTAWTAHAVVGDQISFRGYTQARVNDFLNTAGNGVTVPTLSKNGGTCAAGSNCFELTYVADLVETAVLIAPGMFLFTGATGSYQWYLDTSPDSDVATGAGFRDGDMFLTGQITSAGGTFLAGIGGSSNLASSVTGQDAAIIGVYPLGSGTLASVSLETLVTVPGGLQNRIGLGGVVGIVPYTVQAGDLVLKADSNSEFTASPAVPAVDIEKLVSVDNQVTYYDADSPSGPSTTPGSNVFYKLVVTNPGSEYLTNIALDDSNLNTSGCAITDPLPPGGSFECVLGPIAAVAGAPRRNDADVQAQGQFSGTPVTDTDAAYYVAPPATTPLVDIEKLVSVDNQGSYVDADAPSGPSTTPGSNVFYQLVVTNVGTETLTSVVVNDSNLNTSGCAVTSPLAPGASFACVLGPVAAAAGGPHRNDADVRAVGQTSGTPVTDTDRAYYVAPVAPPTPTVDIEKFVSVDNQATYLDADLPNGPYTTPGSNVFYKLIVTNTGTETLTNIVLSDTDFDTSACTIVDPLAPGDLFECVLGPIAAVAGAPQRNVADVRAAGQSSGATVTDSDAAWYSTGGGGGTAIPTLSQWAQWSLAALVALLGLRSLRRRYPA
jgi:hypothetical protein